MKKRTYISLLSLCIVISMALMVTVVMLLTQSQNFSSNVSASYKSTDVSGKVSATYQIGDGEIKNMVVNGNPSKTFANFKKNSKTTTQNLSPTESQLVLLARQDLLFTYTFVNNGDAPYYAMLNYVDSNDDDKNIDIYYKSENDSEFKIDNLTYITVPRKVKNVAGTTSFQVKLKIHDSSCDANLSGVFNWNLISKTSDKNNIDKNTTPTFQDNVDNDINLNNSTLFYNEDLSKFKTFGLASN